jgi:hypothetical protein
MTFLLHVGRDGERELMRESTPENRCRRHESGNPLLRQSTCGSPEMLAVVMSLRMGYAESRGASASDRYCGRVVQARSVIGVDCATQPKRVGLARATLAEGAWRVDDAFMCSGSDLPLDGISAWLSEEEATLLALDAPLGWPGSMGAVLADHRAGEPLSEPRDRLFNRETDRFVLRLTGKRPLEVGADRIARTAHAALELLAQVRARSGHSIPLAWDHREQAVPAAIEVYPAATLRAYGIDPPSSGRGRPPRGPVLELIANRLDVGSTEWLDGLPRDALDAVICVLAGVDFLDGGAMPPEDLDLAVWEGWIWVRRPPTRRT